VRKRVKAEVFAELSDPVLFPRLSDAEIEQLADHGMRDARFFVIAHGSLWFARMDGGTSIGDVSVFTGEPTIAAGVGDGALAVRFAHKVLGG
jgi:hypothetical protein